MFCSKCGQEIREGVQFCTACGARTKAASLPQRPVESEPVQEQSVPVSVRSGKKKGWILALLLLLLLGIGAGVWYFFLRGGKSIDLNRYLQLSTEGKSGSYMATMRLDVVGLLQAHKESFALDDAKREKAREYLMENVPTAAVPFVLDAAIALEKGLMSGNVALTEDEALAELVLIAALADNSALGGKRGRSGYDAPELKRGKLDKAADLSDGDSVRFSWGEIDAKAVEDIFGLRLKYGDQSFTVGDQAAANASTVPVADGSVNRTDATKVPTEHLPSELTAVASAATEPSAAEAESEAAATSTPSTVERTTAATTTQAATATPVPTTPAPTTAEPTTPIPTTAVSVPPATTTTAPRGDIYEGDIIIFGSYEQDGVKNGQEPIEWIVVKRDGRKVILMSRYVLDSVSYELTEVKTYWAMSYLRSWLNNDFYYHAFSASEMASLQLADCSADMNIFAPKTDQGMASWDYVWAPSLQEIDEFYPEGEVKPTVATRYAIMNGTYIEPTNGYSPYWLRTMGDSGKKAVYIRNWGGADETGRKVTQTAFGVRPCICLDIEIARQYLGYDTGRVNPGTSTPPSSAHTHNFQPRGDGWNEEEFDGEKRQITIYDCFACYCEGCGETYVDKQIVGSRYPEDADIVNALYQLENYDHLPGGDYTLYGQIVEIVTPYDGSKITVNLLVTDGDHLVTAYKMQGGAELKIGDYIYVTGRLTRYDSWYEFVEGCTYQK